MDPDAFVADLERGPEMLRRLGDVLRGGSALADLPAAPRRVVFVGMGSSRFAALPVAHRLRRAGIDAVVEYASAADWQASDPDTLVVGISASGSTPETVAALGALGAGCPTVAVTNDPASPLAQAGDVVLDLAAGEERGGVACRTFVHTVAWLVAVARHLSGTRADVAERTEVAEICTAAAEAREDLLERRDTWLPAVVEVLTPGPATFFLAPVERRSSAEQSALMCREGPRRTADACETGDWLHVDVYLTKPLDYRCVVFAGSRFDDEVAGWVTRRSAQAVVVGGDLPGAQAVVRYRHDVRPDVALLAETLVGELVAATWWRQQLVTTP